MKNFVMNRCSECYQNAGNYVFDCKIMKSKVTVAEN